MEPVRVVIRYANGKLLKGYTNDFFPNKPSFHVNPVEIGNKDKGIEVIIGQLKALFFVKNFDGNPSYYEQKRFPENEQPSGRKVEVKFTDGEVLIGSTLGYDPKRLGFFVTPVDPQSNNLRIFVVFSAVKAFRFL